MNERFVTVEWSLQVPGSGIGINEKNFGVVVMEKESDPSQVQEPQATSVTGHACSIRAQLYQCQQKHVQLSCSNIS